MINQNMTDDEKRAALMDMTYEDLELEISLGHLTWQEFDRLLPEIGAAIGATVMFENTIGQKPSGQPALPAEPEKPTLYGISETSAPYRPPSKPTTYSSPETLGLPKDDPADSEAMKLRRAVQRMHKAQEKTNELLADILKELKRR